MKHLSLAASAIAAATFMAASPAAAQDEAGDKVNQVIIYGDDPCQESTEDEIVVCVVLDEEERYRIPKGLRSDPNDRSEQAWTERVKEFRYVGATGTESCSPVGAGGFTGCTNKFIQQAYEEREASPEMRFGQLIEEARAERLSKIDEEAAAVQARRDAIDAQLDERERKLAEEEEAQAEAAVEAEGELPQPE